MKKPKTYRLSPRTIKALEELKKIYPEWTETNLIEAAIEEKAEAERFYQATMKKNGECQE